ncbi:nitroreductase family protein [Peterkaempfera bronchialis]|uniref:hypothetical protein n=1 Tax=Peterkaempfera bronchialis TaxID=2126346 RepID=UPI001E2F7C4E|nr:hypothetical protein [Peterkaempfera bronchialis]
MTAPHRAARRPTPDPAPGGPGAATPATAWTEILRTLEDHCRRAPSRYNTQPWRLAYERDRITLHWDPARTLPHTDPTRRDLFLSLGAFLETCLIVAADAGLAVHARTDFDETDCRAARLLPADTPYPTPFTTATVETRRTARGPHRPGPLTGTELSAARDQLADLPSARLVHLHTRELAALGRRADRWLLGTPPAVAELRTWLRPTSRHPRYTLDGLTDRALGLTRPRAAALAAAVSPPLHPLLRALGLPRLLAAARRSPLGYDGSVLILVGDATGRHGPAATTPEGLIAHGRALVRTWYALAEHGVGVHPLDALIDAPRTGPQLAARLGGEGRRVLAAFRAGHPVRQPERSARIPARQG